MGFKKRFRGSYVLKVDDRGRIKIPSRYQSILENQYGREVYLTSVNGDYVLLYPLQEWELIEQKIEEIKIRSQVLEDFIRLTSFWGNESEVDARGRILIPPVLREKGDLNDNLLISGNLSHMEIWNKEKFETKYTSKSFTERDLDEVSRILNEVSTLSRDE
jgi:MraZ protein